jgi:hypothetical protein
MPRQNRVTPFSTLIATPARGRWLGNRGCLHDESGRIRRLYQTRRWIICRLEFKGVRRPLMQPGRWTELFFLDEATALAAGHRPCAYCQRAKYESFRAAWAAANPGLAGSAMPGAGALDAVLHAERLHARRERITYAAQLETLPDAAFVVWEDQACLVFGGRLRPWRPEGYGPVIEVPRQALVAVLTPRSVVNILRAGWKPQVDESGKVAG